jgi:hypothetical protein
MTTGRKTDLTRGEFGDTIHLNRRTEAGHGCNLRMQRCVKQVQFSIYNHQNIGNRNQQDRGYPVDKRPMPSPTVRNQRIGL